MNQKGYRAIIRKFLEGVEWAGPRSVSVLIHGHAGKYNWADTELAEMTATKRPPPIKRLISQHHIFATPESRKKDKGEFLLEHDMKLRDVLARHLYATGYRDIEQVSVRHVPGNPDAHIGNLFFELDNGHENDAQLREKLERWAGPGAFQVVFVMAHRYGNPDLEESRLERIVNLGNEILRHKPNRILAAGLSAYLKSANLQNLRGDVVTLR
jgi:hypothetical protein